MMRRTSVAGWPSETNRSANRVVSRSAALSQYSILLTMPRPNRKAAFSGAAGIHGSY